MKFFGLFCFVLMLSFAGSVLAEVQEWNICLDKLDPSAPSNLKVNGNFEISWDAATDTPLSKGDCNYGVDYYNVYLNGELIGTSDGLSYSGDVLSDGSYIIEVSAVDKQDVGDGNEGNRAIVESVFPLSSGEGDDNSGSGGSSGGSGGGSGGSSSILKTTSGSSEDLVEEVLDVDSEVFQEVDVRDSEVGKGFFSMMTGAVIGGGAGSWIVILILVVLVVVLFLVVKKKGEVVVSKKKISKKKVVRKKVKKVSRKK